MGASSTHGGDDGHTSVPGGGRLSKSHPRIEALGAVDELSAVIGLCRSHLENPELEASLRTIQQRLLILGSELAAEGDAVSRLPQRISAREVTELEEKLASTARRLPDLRAFVLSGGVPAAASLHVARTVCRRAERCVVRLHEETPLPGELRQYLNRLSDVLFAFARLVNQEAGVVDAEWRGSAET
ncbi:MAG: ATP:cob(I)alamin adenosyltransferase [Candidatus Riflebacteria bacterium RBG_13_59_9]|nr:MAG: ATP:cob(I)alamin adenosyltransferase [Candidatus Riflebacteria bacterium RBG_13_59_9]